MELTMSKVLLAEYDADNLALKLPEPLVGVKDRERVRVSIDKETGEGSAERPWMALRGCLPPEVADDWRRALEEAAAPDAE
jgi:hypothetical protein